MKIHGILLAAAIAFALPASSFAYTGTLKFKSGCKAANTGSCTLGVSGITGSVKIYASSTQNGSYGAVSNAFTAPASKRIANSANNVCFYAKNTSTSERTRKICL